jgi:putative Holliday junction resolvase
MNKPVAHGRRIGFDFGEKRIGVATSDESAILVSPHATILNDDSPKYNLYM